MSSIGPWEIMLILLVVLLVFGAKRIPEIARGLGKGIREFKDATNDIKKELTTSDAPPPHQPPHQIGYPQQPPYPQQPAQPPLGHQPPQYAQQPAPPPQPGYVPPPEQGPPPAVQPGAPPPPAPPTEGQPPQS